MKYKVSSFPKFFLGSEYYEQYMNENMRVVNPYITSESLVILDLLISLRSL